MESSKYCLCYENNGNYLSNANHFCLLQSSSDLLGLVQVMIVTFGEQPPVYAKPKEQVTPYPTQRITFRLP